MAGQQTADQHTQELVAAVEDGDLQRAHAAIVRGADIRWTPRRDEEGRSLCLLTRAAELGHAPLVTLLLWKGLPVDGAGESLRSPLHWAAHKGHVDVVKMLIDEEADLNKPDLHGNTALHAAAREGHLACVDTLLNLKDANGVPRCHPDLQNNIGRTPFYFAAGGNHIAVMKSLARAGCNIEAKDNENNTALHSAAYFGSLEAVQRLVVGDLIPNIPEGLKTDVKNSVGNTPADEASAEGWHHVEWWLKKQLTRPDSDDSDVQHPLDKVNRCVRRCMGDYNTMRKKIEEPSLGSIVKFIPYIYDGHQQDDTGRTYLHCAAELGLTDVVEVLLKKCGLYPHVLTWEGESPADLAEHKGHLHLHHYIKRYPHGMDSGEESPEQLYEKLLELISKRDDVKKAVELLQKGSPLEPLGECRVSALCSAITSNRPKIVSLLVAAGAPLTTISSGLNLQTMAWHSPDVSLLVKVAIKRVFTLVLKHELNKLQQLPELVKGVNGLLTALEGEEPSSAKWPHEGESVESLTELMVHAARAKCTLTCSYLYLAGAEASLRPGSGVSPLHTALKAQHWRLAERMVLDMNGCLYVSDSTGHLPATILPPESRQPLEKSIYMKERSQLQDLQEKIKSQTEKQQLQDVVEVQERLFATYSSQATDNRTARTSSTVSPTDCYALLVASRNGLQQLVYLLVKVGGVDVNAPVDPTGDTTALHQAASHGKSGCLLLLFSLGADPLLRDRYDQTPRHLAAMFGHKHSYKLLTQLHRNQIPPNFSSPQEVRRQLPTPEEVSKNFDKYYKRYVNLPSTTPQNDQTKATMHLLKEIKMEELENDVEAAEVDYTKGEAKMVKDAVMKELKEITNVISDECPIFGGQLILLGSSEDGTRLYCPDEYDVNLVLSTNASFSVRKQTAAEVLASGHKSKVQLETQDHILRGNNLITKFYDRVYHCLKNYTLHNKKLSLVPPGLTRTQVGVALALAWQGEEYPLLLVSVDLVPVLEVPWLEGIKRPLLTPDTSQLIHLSNTQDGSWRCSFASTEVSLLKGLDPTEYQVFITCKFLLSRMKAEPWMPRDQKNRFSWWDSRYWKVPTPAGFCLKNAFFQHLEEKRTNAATNASTNASTEHKKILTVKSVFRKMCLDIICPNCMNERLVPGKVGAYFGEECERPKVGEGAPEIVNSLETYLQKL
ncbi:serine/threonine-protein phosphatase 6 regulatory ankyrin repeat subunit B [Procambarus clarkii]|uniref:serine/threonine-protein phosphatase 6 regulatory ankyrin repeat subunit B n=1 Tax=Procambarus clarkii TaxID=6728 RepID=UPI00374291DA